MADVFNALTFSRDWRVNGTKDEGGFPTLESREEVVREDMQYLHEETKDFINNTIRPAVQAISDRQTVSFSHVPTIGENGNWLLWSEDEQKYVDSGISAWQGDMSTALEKVAQEAAAAVTRDGLGVYSKEETLSDETKESFGLDATATPDAALLWLREYVNEHGAYMVGCNANTETGTDITEYCDIAVADPGALQLGTGGLETTGFSLTVSFSRLPANTRVVRLPDFSFTGDYSFSSSYAINAYFDTRLYLNGELIQEEETDVVSNFWALSFDDAIPRPARVTPYAGRALKAGDTITVEVRPRVPQSPAPGYAKIENLVVTATNARGLEV